MDEGYQTFCRSYRYKGARWGVIKVQSFENTHTLGCDPPDGNRGWPALREDPDRPWGRVVRACPGQGAQRSVPLEAPRATKSAYRSRLAIHHCVTRVIWSKVSRGR